MHFLHNVPKVNSTKMLNKCVYHINYVTPQKSTQNCFELAKMSSAHMCMRVYKACQKFSNLPKLLDPFSSLKSFGLQLGLILENKLLLK